MKAITNFRSILFSLFFLSNYSFSQCVTVNAGIDQTMCTGSANLLMTYTPVKATTSYTVASTTYAWDATISSTGTTAIATSTDDVYSALIPIGFCFQFYGVTYTQCVVGSNGLITFNNANASAYCPWSYTATLPSTSLPMNSIMAPFHDIDPSVNPASGTSDIKYKTIGVAPCRTFIVSWSNVPMFSSSCNAMIDDQQLILYETTNYIDVMLKNKPMCSGWNGGRAILGVQNSTGTLSTVAPGKNSTQWTEALTGYRFSPDGAEISTVKWFEGATQLSTTTSTTVSPTVTTTYTAQITVPTCAAPGTLVITDNMIVNITSPTTPTFAAVPNVCQNATAPVLPTSSTNSPAITGVWSPAVSTATVGTVTYTFTPDPGQCASTTTNTITTLTNYVPTFAPISDVCINSTPPILPTNSTNSPSISGSWSPTVSTATAGTATYTFTPTVNTCTSTTTLNITTTSSITPTFATIPDVCQNATAPVLPTSSTNSPSITGVWSPAVSTTTLGTTTYTFTPDAGQCAGTTTNTINVTTPITPTFTALADVCQNSVAPVLPTSSTNSPAITGVWAPTVSTATVGTSTYTFTPDAGQCAITSTNTLTVIAPVVPTFAVVSDVCQNSSAPVLPLSSADSPAITGTWAPSVSTAIVGTATYTFTPTSGLCATTALLPINTLALNVPTFTPISDLCMNSAVPTLPSSSNNATPIAGSWTPATVSSSTVGTATYTFTPTSSMCTSTAALNIVTTSTITPTFTAITPICLNSAAPVLPTSSTNTTPLTGVWSPTVSTSTVGTSTYTFTPDAGQCGVNTTLNIVTTSLIVPTFNPVPNVCQNATPPILPTISTNIPGIVGVWSSLVNTIVTGPTTYTFTPNSSQCGTTSTLIVTIDTPIIPTFDPLPSVCQNAPAPALPINPLELLGTTNPTPITGSWLPLVSTSLVGISTYTFTPTPGLCATTSTLNLMVNAPIVPTFDPIASVCQNGTVPVLPTSSTNTTPITGSWSPLVSTSNEGTTTYTFTPSASLCATTTTNTITIIPYITPTFTSIANVCQNDVAPVLNTSSTNNPTINGTWSPAVSTALAGSSIYTFTPTVVPGFCSNTTTMSITVNPQATPLFNTISPLCQGSVAPNLPTLSVNIPPISGTWSSSVDMNTSGTSTYVFTPDADECSVNGALNITIKPLPVLNVTNPKPVCYPLTVDLTDSNVTNGSTGTISYSLFPSGIPAMSNPNAVSSSGVYFAVSDSNGCKALPLPIQVIINPKPEAYFTPSKTILNSNDLTSIMLNSSIDADSYAWYFMDGGTSNLTDPSHTFSDSVYGDQVIVLIATSINGCMDTVSRIVTIEEELIFYVPNAFTPDVDEFNPTFQPVFTSGVDPLDYTLLIFNRWGEIVFESHDASIGWDGKFGGKVILDDTLTWKIDFKIKGKDKHVMTTGHVSILR